MSGYDLLVAGRGEVQIVTLPFYWLARVLALPLFWGRESCYFSITRGRSDIIWRRESAALRARVGKPSADDRG